MKPLLAERAFLSRGAVARRWLHGLVPAAMIGWCANASPAVEQVTPVAADESSRNPLVETSSERDHLTGDWGGWRTKLVERGIHFQLGYVGEVLGNVSGGLKRGAVYAGLAEGAIELDFERITGLWPGGLMRASALFPHGQSASGKLVGDLQTLSNIDAYDGVALYELWLEQNFFDARISLRAGQLLADTEFAFTDFGGNLMNSSFGWPAFISINTRSTGPAYYRTASGVRLRVAPNPSVYVQAGVYDGDTFDSRSGRPGGNAHGVHFHLDGDQGAFGIAEIGWRMNSEEGSAGLPGTYKLGAWLHTADFPDAVNPDRSHDGNFGVYVAGEQLVWREREGADEGLGFFLRAGVSPEDRNLVSFACDGGLHYRGLFPGRDADALVIGVAAAVVSDDVRRAERQAGARFVPDHEIAVELTYQIEIWPSLSIQPDLQWIRHPGASGAIDDAVVVGLRSRFTF